MPKRLIFLTGFMASGKSTIGLILANTLGWNFIDLDRYIEAKASQTIKNIFEEKGEEYFRELEKDSLMEISTLSNHVVALGGGAACTEANLELIKKSGLLIYLKTPPIIIYHRTKSKLTRPLLLDENGEKLSKEAALQKINNLLVQREKFYKRANLVFSTHKKTIGITVDILAKIINKYLYKNEKNINKKSIS